MLKIFKKIIILYEVETESRKINNLKLLDRLIIITIKVNCVLKKYSSIHGKWAFSCLKCANKLVFNITTVMQLYFLL